MPMTTSKKDRNAHIAAHAAFYFITVILDTMRRKGLMTADEIARAIDAYPHEDAQLQQDTRDFLHRCMELIENVPSSPSVAPSDEQHAEEEAARESDYALPRASDDELVRFIDERDGARRT
jgi:hypothetical protein